MAEASIVDEPRYNGDEIKDFNPSNYVKTQFSMYKGVMTSVDILFDNSLTTVVIDRFGKDVIMRPVDQNHFIATVDVEVSPTFFSWIFMFGARAYISSPRSVVKEYSAMVNSILESYPQEQ